jgi:hypothetical protein
MVSIRDGVGSGTLWDTTRRVHPSRASEAGRRHTFQYLELKTRILIFSKSCRDKFDPWERGGLAGLQRTGTPPEGVEPLPFLRRRQTKPFFVGALVVSVLFDVVPPLFVFVGQTSFIGVLAGVARTVAPGSPGPLGWTSRRVVFPT